MNPEQQILLNLATRTYNLLKSCQVPGTLAGECAALLEHCNQIHQKLYIEQSEEKPIKTDSKEQDAKEAPKAQSENS